MTEFLGLHEADEFPVPFIDLVAQYETIAPEIDAAVSRIFASQQFVLGDEVADFEAEIANHCDARFSVGCASGTDALILALQALEIGPGDEVITSPFTFFATGSAIARVGARPIFADIDPVSFNLDPQAVADAVGRNTRAILPVHLFGQCADMDPLWRIAARHGLSIVEDACQAIGATYRGRQAGVLGTVGCFSFFPTKNLGGAGDGGVITTDDNELDERLRRLRMHGDLGGYEHVDFGMNSRLDALQAAVLRVKLKHLDAWTAGRRRNAARYEALFRSRGLSDRLETPRALPECTHVFNQYCVRIPGRRDEVQAALRQRKIGCGVYYPKPVHLQPCFAGFGYQKGQFPVAEQAAKEVLALPIYTELPAAHQDRVVSNIAEVLDAGVRVHRRAA